MKEIRKKRKISQKELANAMNISHAYLNLIEKGNRMIPIDFVKNLNDRLNLDSNEIQLLHKAIENSPFSKSENDKIIARIQQTKNDLLRLIDEFFVKMRSTTQIDINLLNKLIQFLQELKDKIFYNEYEINGKLI